jgi:hypothetical protein
MSGPIENPVHRSFFRSGMWHQFKFPVVVAGSICGLPWRNDYVTDSVLPIERFCNERRAYAQAMCRPLLRAIVSRAGYEPCALAVAFLMT